MEPLLALCFTLVPLEEAVFDALADSGDTAAPAVAVADEAPAPPRSTFLA